VGCENNGIIILRVYKSILRIICVLRGGVEKIFGYAHFLRRKCRLNGYKRPPPPEVAASVPNAVTAVKKHAKPSVNTRDFFIFVIS
ncbi:MAG: hypothetical protein IJ959_02260, partial [Clostridia bacterium]|nr:hypothetical protein [Clostridia bacterium]